MRARDEAAVAIHVALRVRAAALPEGGHVRERQGFSAEDNDLFIDLKPRYLALLKEDVARLLLLRGVENAVDVLRNGSRNFYHPLNTWQTLLTDAEAAQELLRPFHMRYGRRGALLVLSAAVVDFGICRIRLGIFDRGCCIDAVDYVVLPIFPRRRCADTDDWRRTRGCLHISVHHFAATGLCLAHGRDRAFHRAGNRDVRNAEGGLVRSRRRLDQAKTETNKNVYLAERPDPGVGAGNRWKLRLSRSSHLRRNPSRRFSVRRGEG